MLGEAILTGQSIAEAGSSALAEAGVEEGQHQQTRVSAPPEGGQFCDPEEKVRCASGAARTLSCFGSEFCVWLKGPEDDSFEEFEAWVLDTSLKVTTCFFLSNPKICLASWQTP